MTDHPTSMDSDADEVLPAPMPRCTVRWHLGLAPVSCSLPTGHVGSHQNGGLTWPVRGGKAELDQEEPLDLLHARRMVARLERLQEERRLAFLEGWDELGRWRATVAELEKRGGGGA